MNRHLIASRAGVLRADDGWTLRDLPPMTGRTVLVTGSTSGIGLATAQALHQAGADVVLVVRNEVKGRAVADRLVAESAAGRRRGLLGTPPGRVTVGVLDLADLASVRRFAQSWTGPIDVLVNNAGVMMPPLTRTVDGFEMQIGTNHLGHFALTNLLLPYVRGRVVTVSSLMQRPGRIHLDDLNYEHRRYTKAGAYAQAKLANLMFTSRLQRLLSDAGSPIRSVAAHPGGSSTGLGDQLSAPFAPEIFRFGSRFVGQGSDGGALPTLFAATADIPGDTFIGPRGLFQLSGAPTAVGRSAQAYDLRVSEALWSLSEQLTDTSFPFAATTRAAPDTTNGADASGPTDAPDAGRATL